VKISSPNEKNRVYKESGMMGILSKEESDNQDDEKNPFQAFQKFKVRSVEPKKARSKIQRKVSDSSSESSSESSLRQLSEA